MNVIKWLICQIVGHKLSKTRCKIVCKYCNQNLTDEFGFILSLKRYGE